MSHTHLVSLTGTDQQHKNKFIIKTKTIVVLLGISRLSSELDDSFRLTGEHEAYEMTLQRSDAIPYDEQHVALLFTEAPPLGPYSLYHVLTREIEIPIFEGVSYTELDNHGEHAQEPTPDEPLKLSLADPPTTNSNDPLLALNPDDYKLGPCQQFDFVSLLRNKNGKSNDNHHMIA